MWEPEILQACNPYTLLYRKLINYLIKNNEPTTFKTQRKCREMEYLVKMFSVSYGTRRYVAVFTIARNRIPS